MAASGWELYDLQNFGAAASKWCEEQFGPAFTGRWTGSNDGKWYTNKDTSMFVFRDKTDAMQFKLVWTG